MATINQVISRSQIFVNNTFDRTPHIISISPEGDGWLVRAEIIEEDEYMRKRGRRELIGIYDLIFDNNLDIVSFERKGLKERGTIPSGTTGEV